MSGFGKPKYGGGSSFAKTIRLKEGTVTVVRILPPMKSLADLGLWAIYSGTHFGYKGVNQRDPSKPSLRTFKCIEEKDFRSKTLLQDCPECDLIAQREEEEKELKLEAKKAGHSSDEIDELAKPLSDWLRDHNCDRKWKMNVKTQQGEYATLHLSHKTKKKVDAKISSILTEDGIDALDIEQGVWFKFTRTGRGIETEDAVDVEYESVRDPSTGRVSRTIKLAPLTQAEAEQALRECPDLTTLDREISHEQIKLLTMCSGEPEDVDEIFAIGQKNKEGSPGRAQPQRPTTPPPAPKRETPAPAKSEPVIEKPVTKQETSAADEIAALKAQLAKLQGAANEPTVAPEQPKAEPVAEKKSVPATPAEKPAEGLPVDRAAFMARFKKQG